MSSQTGFGSGMLFQTMNDDLNASMAMADELSREFNSLLHDASSSSSQPSLQTSTSTSSSTAREKPLSVGPTTYVTSPTFVFPSPTGGPGSGLSSGSSSGGGALPYSVSPASQRSHDSAVPSNRQVLHSAAYSPCPLTPPQPHRDVQSPLSCYGQQSPVGSPRSQRRDSPSQYNRSPRGSVVYTELVPSPTPFGFDQSPWPSSPRAQLHPASGLLSPYDSSQMGRRSPRPDRSPSPRLNNPLASTLPRNFGYAEEGVQRPKGPGRWNETDLDASYEKKPHHTYDKSEWRRTAAPNSGWRESNLDGPPLAPSPKDSLPRHHLPVHSSLPRNARIAVPPDAPGLSQASHSAFHQQPIVGRISIPPANARPRQRRPIPLSVIMRLQNPHWAAGSQPTLLPLARDYLPSSVFPPAMYGEVLNSGDVDAELEKLDLVHYMPAIPESSGPPEGATRTEQRPPVAPRPLSPTRLQPVVAPEAQSQVIPDLEELLRIRAEIPRALKRRGSVDQSQPLKKASLYQPNQYKHLINKLLRRKKLQQTGEKGSENSSSSEEEEPALPPCNVASQSPQDYRKYHSILRRSKNERKISGRHARLNPLVLLLDGALVGELETVQKAAQEMSDPSQANDEGITALHNAICGGHYNVVDFLVRIGANVSAPDSHGWTPLHCAASCNDRPLCEFLVRNGAAVMAVTESDGATAAQKCDPYAVGFEDCESFLRGVEEAMGVENSGVLYGLWSYPAQAADELSFKEGDMVTILQKPEGVDWWFASLCGREGFVPNNYFGLFPKVRTKSLC